ncbi:hypothetical protein HYS47_03825 [Candidatus Woesearchaeota archaeon]|nr:hypothetical protein [Candidatus Woesearchaeota archaeon]
MSETNIEQNIRDDQEEQNRSLRMARFQPDKVGQVWRSKPSEWLDDPEQGRRWKDSFVYEADVMAKSRSELFNRQPRTVRVANGIHQRS